MRKKSTLILSTILILLTACGEEKVDVPLVEKHEKKQPIVETPPQPKILNEILKPQTSNDLLKQLGFDFNGEKVVIDINKTSNFLKKVEIEMHGKLKEIENKIDHAQIDITKGIGIELSNEKVAIDLNKTRNMLQQINTLMKDIVLDINSTVH